MKKIENKGKLKDAIYNFKHNYIIVFKNGKWEEADVLPVFFNSYFTNFAKEDFVDFSTKKEISDFVNFLEKNNKKEENENGKNNS